MPVRQDHWTSEDIQALIGRSFKDRKGLIRVVTRVEGMDVYWRRHGGNERKVPMWWTYFRESIPNDQLRTIQVPHRRRVLRSQLREVVQ
jgi:hypothetical protein